MIEEIVKELIYPLLKEYKVDFWKYVDYIPLADMYIKALSQASEEDKIIDVLVNEIKLYLGKES